MSIDCYFAKIHDIKPHPNADSLDIGFVNNWQVIIPKNTWKENELGLYICPDACLPSDKEWAKEFLSYTGKLNRVKIIKLRGEYSNGIFVKVDKIRSCFPIENGKENIVLGITHYNPPLPNDLSIESATLPYGLSKTDEENWQSLSEDQLYIGTKALVTKKMDGCSATYVAAPDGTFIYCSRRFTYKPECSNRYTIIGNQLKDRLLAYALKHNKVIAVRGEITGVGINKSKINKDSVGEIKFNLYNCTFPEESNEAIRNGYYGQDTHFLKVNEELDLPTVPINGIVTITKELLLEYQNAPAEDGEGVVLNHPFGSYKAKSAEYYSLLK